MEYAVDSIALEAYAIQLAINERVKEGWRYVEMLDSGSAYTGLFVFVRENQQPLPDYTAQLIAKINEARSILGNTPLSGWLMQAADYIEYAERHGGTDNA